MADFGGLGDVTDVEAGEGPPTTGQAPAIRTGLLSPSTFPLAPPDASQAHGPVIAPQPPILSGPLDPDVHAEVLQDIQDAQARLPSLPPAQGPGDPADGDAGWLAPPAPLFTAPLDTDTRAEVLRDIQNAQARLPPASPRSVHPLGNSVAPDLSNSSSRFGFGSDGAAGNNGSALFPLAGGPRTLANSISSFVFADPASKLRPLDPNVTHIGGHPFGGQPFRIVDTGTGERLVPDRSDVRVSANVPFVRAPTPSEALQKSVQEEVINPSLFMAGGGDGVVPAEWAPRGRTLPFPADMAAAKGYPGIGTTGNGGPTFAGTPYLYPAAEGQLNTVEIPLTGSRRQDTKAANAMAGFAREPPGYTWHHVDDFNPATGTGSLELVQNKAHNATSPHAGSVAQYENSFGIRYRR